MRHVAGRVGAAALVLGAGLVTGAAPALAVRGPGLSLSVSHWGQGTVATVYPFLATAPYTLTEIGPSGAVMATVPCDPTGSSTGSTTPVVCTTGVATAAGDTWTATDATGLQSVPGSEAPRAMWVEDVHPTTGDTTSWVFPDQPANIVAAAAADGITELFMAVPNGALTAQTAQYQQLVIDAHQAGIAVDALSGDPSWATDGGAGAGAFVRAVIAYDQADPQASFDGVHLDIEPWALSPTWQTDQAGADVTGYLSALGEATSLAHGAGLITEADITDWLDTVAVAGTSQDLAQAVQASVDQVTIMSYQADAADQFNHAQAELAELAPNGPVRLAADTVAGDAGSYAGQTDDAVWTQLATLDALASSAGRYLGVALFDYSAISQLPPGTPSQVSVTAVPVATLTAAVATTRQAVMASSSAPAWQITVTVTGSPGEPTPTGEVALMQDGAYLAGGLLGPDGTATFTESLPSAGGITARYSGDSVYAPSTSLIPQKITLGPVPATDTYGNRIALSATGGGSQEPVVFSPDSASTAHACSVTPDGHVTLTAVGACVIDADQAGSGTYARAPQVREKIEVLPAPLALTVSDQSAIFGAAVPVPVYRYTGFVNSDTEASAIKGRPDCQTVPAGTPGGVYPITCGQGSISSPNYTLSFVPGRVTISYTSVVSSAHTRALSVGRGQAVLIRRGASVDGPITVEAGGSLDVEGALVHGPLLSRDAGAVRVCSAQTHGPLWVSGSTGIVVVGDDDGLVACGSNTIGGPVVLIGNSSGVEFDDNFVTGPVVIAGTGGDLPAPDSGSLDVTANKALGPHDRHAPRLA